MLCKELVLTPDICGLTFDRVDLVSDCMVNDSVVIHVIEMFDKVFVLGLSRIK